jgi:carnitine 3-dehydrogenase
VAHPFNPVYLLPLVEIVGGKQTAPETIERAKQVYSGLGMKPLVVRKEIEAFIGDRLLEALWREALWLVHDDVATAEEIDDVIRYSFGLRWAQMGTFMVYRIAGGEAGMRHFMNQFGPALKWPWTKLTTCRSSTMRCRQDRGAIGCPGGRPLHPRAGAHTRRQSGGHMQALRAQNGGKGWGAGALLKQYEERLLSAPTGRHRPRA